MFKKQNDGPTQFNLNSVVLAPMRDLILSIRRSSLIDLFMATSSEEELKAKTLEKEIFFQARFKFEANRPVREQIIQLQEKYQLTDGDIRRLYRSSWLSIRSNVVTLKPERRKMFWIQLQMTVITLICAFAVLAAGLSHYSPARQVLTQLVMVGIWVVMTFPTYWYSLRPWRTLKDAGVV